MRLNILQNGGNISIRIYGSKDMISVDIKDEGLGIPEDALPNLFQQFYRVDNSDRRRIGGTGLGLAIVSEIIRNRHNGTIKVKSQYGTRRHLHHTISRRQGDGGTGNRVKTTEKVLTLNNQQLFLSTYSKQKKPILYSR